MMIKITCKATASLPKSSNRRSGFMSGLLIRNIEICFTLIRNIENLLSERQHARNASQNGACGTRRNFLCHLPTRPGLAVGLVWHSGEGKYYLQMICGVYAVLRAVALAAARTASEHRSLILFAINAGIMAAQSNTDDHERGHLSDRCPDCCAQRQKMLGSMDARPPRTTVSSVLNLNDVGLGAFDERQHCRPFLCGNLESIQSCVQVAGNAFRWPRNACQSASLIRMPLWTSFMSRPV